MAVSKLNQPARSASEAALAGASDWNAEESVLHIFLILLVAFVVLALLLAASTPTFQNFLYENNELTAAIYWRAPAAAAVLTLLLSIWVYVDSHSIQRPDEAEGRYQPLFNFSLPYETITYEHLWIIEPNRQGEQHYVRRGNAYVGPGGRRLPTRPLQIVAAQDVNGEKHVFKPELNAQGRFKVRKDQTALRYYEDGDTKKRYMDENYPGQIRIFHFSWLLVSFFLHLGFLLAWFVSLWLLLRFQWPHALGLALGFWLVSLIILPSILSQAENVRKQQLTRQAAPAAGRSADTPVTVARTSPMGSSRV